MTSRFINWNVLREIGAPGLAAMTTTEATERLRANGVPCGIANESAGVRAHAQLASDGFLVTRDDAWPGPITTPLPAARCNSERDHDQSPADAIGARTRVTLAGLGLTPDAINAAFASGAAHEQGHRA